MANRPDYTPEELQHLFRILAHANDDKPIPATLRASVLCGLIRKTSELAAWHESGAAALEVGQQYRLEDTGHWANGKAVTIDAVRAMPNGARVEFHTTDANGVAGYSWLPPSCFKPLEAIAVEPGKTYTVVSNSLLHGSRVVVLQVQKCGGTALVHTEGSEDVFAVLTSHLRAVAA